MDAGLYGSSRYCNVSGLAKPLLIVVIDTEEGFDWSKPHSRNNTDVSAMSDIGLVQKIFDKYDLKPCYVVDYPIATQSLGNSLLKTYLAESRCVIGAHLHPWVNPPHDEKVSRLNSFPGNLEYSLERDKLSMLLDAIAENLGSYPQIYKAGRYGFGRNTPSIMDELRLSVDLSPTPGFDYSLEGGPDFSDYSNSPFWFGPGMKQLCIPCSGGYVGHLGRYSSKVYRIVTNRWLNGVKAPGIMSRLRLLERIRLSPEGFSLHDMKRVANYLVERGDKILTMSFHSPTVTPGWTPYVSNKIELADFLGKIEGFLGYFREDVGGGFTDPVDILGRLSNPL